MEPIRLAVRKVVELILRGGDIDSRYVDSSAMYEGAKAHRKIQKSMGPDYQKEVSLRIQTESGGVPVLLFGRADGVIFGADGSVIVDEIKTTTQTLDHIAAQSQLHTGQAKCYAYMLSQTMEEPPDIFTVQITYYQLETEEIRRHSDPFTREELDTFFSSLMEKYGCWLRFEHDWRMTRDESIKSAGFPFPSYRKGQRELAVAVYRSIERGKRLYAQAPTGIGKTLSSLFPSIKAMGEGKTEKLFYLTAKTVTRAVAEDAIRLMGSKGLRFKSVTLRAKDKICFCEETICNPDSCPFAKGHYDRINGALLELLEEVDLITPDIVEKYAKKHRVCPFEMALDAALWTDLVICDYNHVFDPAVYLKRFFSDENGGNYVFLIDEAHNLGDRVRDMYTAAVRKRAFYRLKRGLKDKNPIAKSLRKAMDGVNKYMIGVRRELGERASNVDEELDTVLTMLLSQFTASAEEWLAQEQYSGHPLHGDMLELYFEVLHFLGISEIYDERYSIISEADGGDTAVTLFCLDPSQIISKRLEFAKSSILFSATLTPLPYYREMLGGSGEDGMLALPSPFEQDRLLLAAHGGISTKYADRPLSYGPIAEAIYLAVSKKRGNYLVFFPSYDYMRKVHERFAEEYPHIPTLLQQGSMSEQERAEFLLRFDAENAETLVGFGVLGGIFSEGIDLAGERLIGSIIVGVGLPGISLRQDLIRDYFDARKGTGNGYDYAYVYPGMNKVLQAAGRVIRTEEDYGVVLLIDSRFHTAKYKGLYPSFWSHMNLLRFSEELAGLIEGFPYFK